MIVMFCYLKITENPEIGCEREREREREYSATYNTERTHFTLVLAERVKIFHHTIFFCGLWGSHDETVRFEPLKPCYFFTLFHAILMSLLTLKCFIPIQK
jgi:hypothetical protein